MVVSGPDWWKRNWKWVIPAGCLVSVIVAAAAGAGIVWVAFGMIRHSEVYRQAMERARNDPRVRQTLGEPLDSGWWVAGNISISGASGSADLMIPITGPRNSGRIFAVAERRAGTWEFLSLEVEVRGRDDRIDLLEPPALLEVEELDAPDSDFRLSRLGHLHSRCRG